jgi:hypothetical protein
MQGNVQSFYVVIQSPHANAKDARRIHKGLPARSCWLALAIGVFVGACGGDMSSNASCPTGGAGMGGNGFFAGAGGAGGDSGFAEQPSTATWDCTLPTEPLTSSRAIELAHCLPETAKMNRVTFLLSDRDGRLDAQGKSYSWTVILVDDARQHFATVVVSAEPSVLIINEGLAPECRYLTDFVPAPSDDVILDAELRYGSLDPITVDDYRGRFYEQNADCADAWDPAIHHVLYSHQDYATGDTISFEVRYTWEGAIVDFCGPCAGNFTRCCSL